MADKSIGFIETFGLAACVAAADAAVKSANVKLLGFEYAKGDGMCTVKVEGNVGACKAAVEAGKKAAEAVQGSLSGQQRDRRRRDRSGRRIPSKRRYQEACSG